MARGDVYDSGAVRLEVVRAARDTDGALLELAATYAPGSQAPPMHYHPEQEETFTVQRGALWFIVDRAERVVPAGDEIVVPRMARHQARNASETEEAVTTWITRPALRTEEMFAAMYNWRKRGGGILPMALIAREFRRELVLASPPRAIQSCAVALLATVARVMGHRLR
jgi:quercetin dioxygenase-like cupin family protein